MPRKPRLFFPDQPVHIVKRGHNRDPIVARKADYQYFVQCLAAACREYDVALHAWVLMTNHIHLLASPGTEASIPRMMQWLGGHYARYFNRCYRRSGSLWEGRYKTSLIDSDAYLLKCYRYIELNPVRAGMVEHPRQYPWSSYRENAGLGFTGVRLEPDSGSDTNKQGTGSSHCENSGVSLTGVRLKDTNKQGTGLSLSPSERLLTAHPVYLALSSDVVQRYAAYQSLFDDELDRRSLLCIRSGIEKNKPVGNPEFLLKVARMHNRSRGQA